MIKQEFPPPIDPEAPRQPQPQPQQQQQENEYFSPTTPSQQMERDETLVINLINELLGLNQQSNNNIMELDSQQKVSHLSQVEEILFHKYEKRLLPRYLRRVLELHLDTSSSVKCFLAHFIQRIAIFICHQHVSTTTDATVVMTTSSGNVFTESVNLSLMKDCVETLLYLYNDDSPKVLKSVIASTTVCYMKALLLICKISMSSETQTDCTKLWSIMTQLRRRMADSLDNEHEGVRAQAIHFFEYLIIAYSAPPPTPFIVATRKGSKFTFNKQSSDDEFNLNMIPQKHPLLDVETIRKEGEQYFALLLTNATNKSIKFSNISVIHQCLFNIAKQRSNWWDQIIPILYDPPLPPHLTSSQQISLRFSHRSILLYLLKMPALKQYRTQIAATLKKLDTKSDAIDASIRYADRAAAASRSKEQEASKVAQAQSSGSTSGSGSSSSGGDKKRKMSSETDNSQKKKKKKQGREIPPLSILFDTPIGSYHAVDLANLVVDNFLHANVHPKDSTYQLSDVSFSNILMNMTSELEKQDHLELQTFVSEPLPPNTSLGSTASVQDPRLADPRLAAMKSSGSGAMEDDEDQVIIQRRVQTEQEIEEKKVARQTFTKREFESRARPLSSEEQKFMLNVGWEHILSSETEISREGKESLRIALLVKMVAKKLETSEWFTDLLKHIRQDVKSRMDLAIQWLFQEYMDCCVKHERKKKKNTTTTNGNKVETQDGDVVKMEDEDAEETESPSTIDFSRYERLFHSILQILGEELEPTDALFSQYYVKAPRITPQSLDIVRAYIEDPDRVVLGLETLRDIILTREPVRNLTLTYMLDYSIHENIAVRTTAIRILVDQLLLVADFTGRIEEFARDSIKKLLDPATIESIKEIAEEKRRKQVAEHERLVAESGEGAQVPEMPKINFESDQAVRYCSLISSLSLLKSDFFTFFLSVFSDLKKNGVDQVILDAISIQLRAVAKHLGLQSTVIVDLLKSFPDELEDLVLHFVEDLTPPTVTLTPDLIAIIKSIFFSRSHKNARFLLPVIQYLTKDELERSLEHVLNLDVNPLRACIQRLINANSSGTRTDVYTPQELLFTLHKYGNTTDQEFLKKVVSATLVCFGREYRQVFNPNVLASVIQQLLEMKPLPQLLMRTVIQTMKSFPMETEEFIVNVLLRLIDLKIWENKDLWIGFLTCLDFMKEKNVSRVHEILTRLPSKYNWMIFSDKTYAAMKEKLRMFCISNQPKNSSNQLLKHLGFKYGDQQNIVTLSREEIEQVAKEAEEEFGTQ